MVETEEAAAITDAVETAETKKAEEQTLIGKILGWFFGIIFCISIFSVLIKK